MSNIDREIDAAWEAGASKWAGKLDKAVFSAGYRAALERHRAPKSDKQINEALDPPADRLKHMRRLLAEHNYYGNPIDDDFAALDAALAALERQRVPEGDKDE